MRDLRGNDIGQAVDFRDQEPAHQTQHPWPEETTVSAGNGVVFRQNPPEGEERAYMTLFMEVYPPDASFIRGQGETKQACEDAAWAKYQLALNCTDGTGEHTWEPRHYRNGVGFCSRCNTYKSRAFTEAEVATFGQPAKEQSSGLLDGLAEALVQRAQRRASGQTPSTSMLEDLRDSVLDTPENNHPE